MNEILAIPFFMFAGFIAYIGYNTKNRYILMALFLEFIFVMAYEFYVFDPASNIVFTSHFELSNFYGYRLLMQAVFTTIYIQLHHKGLTAISLIICGVLGLSTIISLYNIDVAYYEGIMLALSACQLIAGFGSAVGGYIGFFNSIRSRAFNSGNNGLFK